MMTVRFLSRKTINDLMVTVYGHTYMSEPFVRPWACESIATVTAHQTHRVRRWWMVNLCRAFAKLVLIWHPPTEVINKPCQRSIIVSLTIAAMVMNQLVTTMSLGATWIVDHSRFPTIINHHEESLTIIRHDIIGFSDCEPVIEIVNPFWDQLWSKMVCSGRYIIAIGVNHG